MEFQASKRNIRTFIMLNQFNETLFKLLGYEQAMELMVTFSSADAPTQKRYGNFPSVFSDYRIKI